MKITGRKSNHSKQGGSRGSASRDVEARRSNLFGFSLVEVLCAIMILGVALVGLTQAVTTALQSSKESELQTAAALIAAGRIEQLRAEGGIENGESESDLNEDSSPYHWKQTITAAGVPGLHEVAVTVENSRSGKAIYELRTLLFEAPDSGTPATSGTRRETGSRNRGTR